MYGLNQIEYVSKLSFIDFAIQHFCRMILLKNICEGAQNI